MDLVIDPDLPTTLHGDRRRLTQVLVNLLGNACKFTDQGRVRLHAMAMPGRWFALAVQDTGCGIPAADLGRLFTPFVQLDASSSRRHEGSGLGLAISRRLVEAMGGRMEVDSLPGQGSCFRVVLPLEPVQRSRNGTGQGAAPAEGVPQPGLLTS
jgi:signal transduction histidine kinase